MQMERKLLLHELAQSVRQMHLENDEEEEGEFQGMLEKLELTQLLLLTRAKLDTLTVDAELQQSEERLDSAVIAALHSVFTSFTSKTVRCEDPCECYRLLQLSNKYFDTIAE